MNRLGVFPQKRGHMMKYRNVEYTVLQGIERGVWKWSASVTGVTIQQRRQLIGHSLRNNCGSFRETTIKKGDRDHEIAV